MIIEKWYKNHNRNYMSAYINVQIITHIYIMYNLRNMMMYQKYFTRQSTAFGTEQKPK